MKYIHLTIIIATMLLFPSFAQAQESNKAPPLEITADYSLEWDRNNKVFTANKNAVAKQGELMISSETLKAYYRKENGKSMTLYKLVATGNVKINSKGSVAYGDNVEYNIDEKRAVMTGNALKMVSDDQVLTAKDNFEYWVEEGRLVANGAVKIIRPKINKSGKDILEASSVTAIMKENKQGKRILDRLIAQNSVKITTPTETLTGKKGVYKAARNIAEITGDVKIIHGKNILQGEKATVDLNTNISRMFGGASAGGTGTIKRVRGIFYPGSQKKKDKKPELDSSANLSVKPILDTIESKILPLNPETSIPPPPVDQETTQKPVKLIPPTTSTIQNKAPKSGQAIKRVQAVQPSFNSSLSTERNPQIQKESPLQQPDLMISVPGNSAPSSRLLTAPTPNTKNTETKIINSDIENKNNTDNKEKTEFSSPGVGNE